MIAASFNRIKQEKKKENILSIEAIKKNYRIEGRERLKQIKNAIQLKKEAKLFQFETVMSH